MWGYLQEAQGGQFPSFAVALAHAIKGYPVSKVLLKVRTISAYVVYRKYEAA